MAVTAQDVKKLRDMTGAGMMDCKKALTEVGGDLEAASEYLQKKGITKAQKKASRVAAEGLVATWLADDAKAGVVCEVNCETDFVARNEHFVSFVDQVTRAIGEAGVESIDQIDKVSVGPKKLTEYVTEQIATIGENIKLRRFRRMHTEDGVIGHYIHAGGQIGVLTKIGRRSDEAAQAFARDIAMHVAAMKPGYLSPDDVEAEAAAKQEEIFAAQLKEEGKPDAIIPKIMTGKMRKWRNEGSLLEQAFVKNSDLSVREFQEQSGGVTIESFERFEVGEGIEKQDSDLASEVAATLKS